MSVNPFESTLSVGEQTYRYCAIESAIAKGLDAAKVARLPRSLKVVLENLLRSFDESVVTFDDLQAVVEGRSEEIAYRPARVLMQDFTGVPAVVDLASMRDAAVALGGTADAINPQIPVDLVIDHSVQVDAFGSPSALSKNIDLEMERNGERYRFLKWGQRALDNFRVVPPGTGICHQVNLEYLAKVVWVQSNQEGLPWAYPDTLVGTDSHTTMVNGLGVLGWGVGGIEAEAAMLGQPISMLIPKVVGVKLTGRLPEGVLATDLVLHLTALLREHQVVGKFVEFYGPGVNKLPVADRSTIANMAPEYGATCGFFPVDEQTLNYLRLTGRDETQLALVEAYSKAQGLWLEDGELSFSESLELDLSVIVPSLAGPKRPQDRLSLSELPARLRSILPEGADPSLSAWERVPGEDFALGHGAAVIAAITSCTNTSNPSALIAAGLLARKARALGLRTQPWVKTSFAPGSKVVTRYLEAAGLQADLDALGFYLVGYGCTTCIGNSGPLPEAVAKAIDERQLSVSAVLSGNRNFEGRVHPQVKANWLASPPLVVAFAIAGRTDLDLTQDPIGYDTQNQPVYLKEVWPSNQEIADCVLKVDREMFLSSYDDVFRGDEVWQRIDAGSENLYAWPSDSSYICRSPFFESMEPTPAPLADITGARILALLGDSVTTDHISPAGVIKADSPAGVYLREHGVKVADFNSYGARRGHHEVMARGTFANIRIRNQLVPEVEGGVTRHLTTGETLSIYDAAMRYQEEGIPLVVVAGREYGTGSSRDWAAKGPKLLGVSAVLAQSFERIHRSNLIGMGILPLEYDPEKITFSGDEKISIPVIKVVVGGQLPVHIQRSNGESFECLMKCRIDTDNELRYFKNGGILQAVLRQLVNKG